MAKTDFVSVTELSGDEVSAEQVQRLCSRYYWAGEYCQGKEVVEVACGSGQGAGYLQNIAGTLCSGDYSNDILSIACKHYCNRIDFQQFDAQQMPFAEKSKDVIMLFEAIYYIPDANRFVGECARVLRPGGKVLIATANKDLYDFNPSPHSFRYYGVLELKDLFEKHGFETEFFGDTPVGDVSVRQRILRPIKKLAVSLKIMPKTTGGKKWLKRIVFGDLVKMPAELGPPIGPNEAPGADEKGVYMGRYVEPKRIPGTRADREHKVIFCAATLGT